MGGRHRFSTVLGKMHWKKWLDIAIPKREGGMGFRDIQLFNQAMLAKQGWRLLTSPDSLCARILKGKYFHDCEFMEARNKQNSSHTWRAILHSWELLSKGLIKRVGDGSSIRIWEDPWIPESYSKRLLAILPNAIVIRVEELLQADLGGWDMHKLEGNFLDRISPSFLESPLARSKRTSGRLTWTCLGSFQWDLVIS
jgi:hypothetical protein